MKIQSIHQFLPVLARYDAIGQTTLQIQKSAREWGFESEIFVEKPIDQTAKLAQKYTEYKSNESDLIIYHHSISSELANFTSKLNNPKILFYHNITPERFFEKYDKSIASQCYLGRVELQGMVNHFENAMAVSEYSRIELQNLGFKNVMPMQYFLNLERFGAMKLKQDIAEKYGDTTNVIFVGRKSPNKKIEDILKVFAYFKIFNPKSRLFLLGGSWGVDTYYKELHQLEQVLRLSDCIFINTLTDEELASYYKIADVFLCMSEHEGFCVPLVEAIYFDVPIVAYDSSAIPDTLGGTGILVSHKRYSEIATILEMITTNDTLAKSIVDKQRERLEFFNNNNAIETFRKNLDSVISENQLLSTNYHS